MIAYYNETRSNEQMMPRWKRILDITLVVLALPLLLVIGGTLALIIRRVSRGPIFFRQERVGYNGRPFMLLKFRTMHQGAATDVHQSHQNTLLSSDAPMLKMDARGDSRIIPLGIWIRAAGLDELPQLINVLLGEMSLVGPRPCLPFELDKYRDWRVERFNTQPGLTGLWQVSGKNNTTFQEMVQLDIEYSRTKTLALDLEIIVRTIPALIVQVLEMRRFRKQVSIPISRHVASTTQQVPVNCRSYGRQTTYSGRNLKPVIRNVRAGFRQN